MDLNRYQDIWAAGASAVNPAGNLPTPTSDKLSQMHRLKKAVYERIFMADET
jgi:hypothetical protein